MLTKSQIRSALAQMGVAEDRLDADTAHVSKELEYVFTRTYDRKYPELKARKFIPVNNEVPPGADTYTYFQWDAFGMAEIISNYADDLPMVDALKKEFVAKIVSIGAAYSFSIQDMRRSQMSGQPLDEQRAMAVRRVIEQRIDNMGATGDSRVGMTGMLNNPNVPLIAPVTGAWVQGVTTAAQILGDLNKLVNSVVNTTKEIFIPDTVLLSNTDFQIANTTRIDTTLEKSVLASWLENNPYVQNVDQWNKLNTASAGAGRRAVAYKRDPEVLELIIPQEFEQFPPQPKNLAFRIPTHARVGGVSVRYPIAMAYMDIT